MNGAARGKSASNTSSIGAAPKTNKSSAKAKRQRFEAASQYVKNIAFHDDLRAAFAACVLDDSSEFHGSFPRHRLLPRKKEEEHGHDGVDDFFAGQDLEAVEDRAGVDREVEIVRTIESFGDPVAATLKASVSAKHARIHKSKKQVREEEDEEKLEEVNENEIIPCSIEMPVTPAPKPKRLLSSPKEEAVVPDLPKRKQVAHIDTENRFNARKEEEEDDDEELFVPEAPRKRRTLLAATMNPKFRTPVKVTKTYTRKRSSPAYEDEDRVKRSVEKVRKWLASL